MYRDDALFTLARVSNAHERFHFQVMSCSDLHDTGVVLKRRVFADVLKDALVGRLETTEQPPKPGTVHRDRLLVGEQLRLDEAAQTKLDPETLLKISDGIHHFNNKVLVDVQLIVEEVEAREPIRLVERLDLLNNALFGTSADLAEHLRIPTSAEIAS